MSAPERDQIAHTETQSASLRRELRLPDLVLLQVLLIMGLPWIGYAAKLGGTHAVLWLAAIALFYFPLAGTVIYLSRRLPLEGGIYQWAKIGLSPFAGFQAAWNYSFFLICVAFGALSLVNVGEQEATQLLVGAGMACSGMYYLTMFAVVLWGRLDGAAAALWLKLGACSAAGVTLLAALLQVVPI